MKRSFILLLILFANCAKYKTPEVILEELPENGMQFQKMVIGQLSGEKPIITSDEERKYLGSRWDNKERELTISYFNSLIGQLGLKPMIHYYKIPNVNFAVDLVIEPLSGKNVYTILKSTTQSSEYVVLGAHYDTGGANVPGAIDNGSGIALISEVLRRVCQIEHRTKNLIVIFFDQEEEDISAGSTAFANYLIENGYNVDSVHSFDLIGWDSDNNKEVELELPSPRIEKLYKMHAKRLNIPVYITKVNSSDHYSFIQKGFEAVGISQAYAKGDNSGKKDTLEDKFHLVNFEYLMSSTELAFEVIKTLIND